MEEKMTSKSNALRLPGAAPKGVYSFRDHKGKVREDGMHTIFPIVKQVEGGDIQLIGTGFFIAGNGVFATAKHVLFDVLDDNGQQTFPIGIFHFLPDDQFIIRPVLRCSHNSIADVAIGVAAPATHNETGEFLNNPTLILTTEVPDVGDLVTTYAYPNTKIERVGTKQVINFIPDFYEGRLEEMHLDGRDASMLPGPCYRTSIFMHGGASGGPVVDQRGRVFGINSTGFHGMDVSYVSRINELFPLSLDVEESGTVRTLSIPEIANRGWITFDPDSRRARDLLIKSEAEGVAQVVDRLGNPLVIPMKYAVAEYSQFVSTRRSPTGFVALPNTVLTPDKTTPPLFGRVGAYLEDLTVSGAGLNLRQAD